MVTLQAGQKFRELGVDGRSERAVSIHPPPTTSHARRKNLPPARDGIPTLGIDKASGIAAGVAAHRDIGKDLGMRVLRESRSESRHTKRRGT